MRKISCAQSWLQVLWARSQCVFAVFSLLSVFSQHRQSQPVNREKSRDQMHRVWSLLLTWHWNRGGVNPSRLCTGPGFLSGWTLTDDACSARRIAHKTGNDLLTAVERRVPSPRSQPAQADRDTWIWNALRTPNYSKIALQGRCAQLLLANCRRKELQCGWLPFLLPQVWLYHACQPLKWMEPCAPRCAETLPGQGHWEFPLNGHSHRVPKWALTTWAGGPSRYSLQQLRPFLLKVSLLGGKAVIP